MSDVVFVIATGRGRDPGWLDQVTDELADDLQAIGVTTARRTSVGFERGVKSGTMATFGELVASGGAAGVAAWTLRDIIRAFLERTRAGSVTVRKGDRELTIERPTDGQVDDIVARMEDLLRDE
jgi:hypothetical protein